MQLNTITNQTIALAGIAQAAALVQQLAVKGSCDQDAFEACVSSLLKIDSDSVIDVYGSLGALTLGINQLNVQMVGLKIHNPEQSRYSASLVFLENKLSSRKDLLQIINTGIVKAQSQSEHFGLLHENVLANFSEIYQNTISTLQPRIMVNGNPDYLSRNETANKIRTCLLAGIRSAILWRQCGGTRWKFLFYRKKIQAELQELLNQI